MLYIIFFFALYACVVTSTSSKHHFRGPHLAVPGTTWPEWLPSPTASPSSKVSHFNSEVPLSDAPMCPPPPPPPPCPCLPSTQAPWPIEPEDGGESLRSKTGWYLAVDANRREVFGIKTIPGALQVKRRRMRRSTSLTDVLRSAVTIQEINTKLYIAMNAYGNVYAETDKASHNVWWQQSYDSGTYRFSWLGNNGSWFLGIKKDGKMMRGDLTDSEETGVQWERNDQGQEKNPYTVNLPHDTVGEIPPWVANVTGETDVKQLLGWRGFNLAVNSDGLVYGHGSGPDGVFKNSLSALYLFSRNSLFWPRDVQIKGKSANLYIAMNDQGYVYGEPDGRSDNTWWKVAYAPGDNKTVTFEWLGNSKGWFLGIQKSGRMKSGSETNRNDYAAKFFHPRDVWTTAPWPVEPEDGGESLRSKTGWYLAVDPNRREVFGISTVKGNLQVKRRRMRRSTLTDVLRSAVTIKEINSKLYVAMNAKGDVYAESDKGSHNIWWQQSYEKGGSYRFSWLGNNGSWFLGIQEDGQMMRGYESSWDQTGAQFERNDQGQEKNPYPENLPDDTVGDIPTWGANATGETDEKQLLCRSDYNLAVNSDGEVYGEGSGRFGVKKTSLSALYLLRRPSLFWPRDVQIKAKMANLYVAMNDKGIVYAEPDGGSDNTWWKVAYAPDRNYVTFEWLGNSKGWLLGIQRFGLMLRGNETNKLYKDNQFVHPLDVWT